MNKILNTNTTLNDIIKYEITFKSTIIKYEYLKYEKYLTWKTFNYEAQLITRHNQLKIEWHLT